MSRSKLRRLVSACLLLASVVVAVRAAVAPIEPAQPPQTSAMQVVDVQDGDTISVRINGQVEKVRLIGVDTPETKDPRKPVQCFGQEASEWTKRALEGRQVRLESDPSQGARDKYDRLLAYVWRDDGMFINRSLIEEGYGHEYTYASQPYKYQQEFQRAELAAESARRGLWADDTCAGDTKKPA